LDIALFLFLGDGFKALRVSMASLQAVGLFFGLWAARSVVRQWSSLAVFGLILILWMLVLFRSLEYCLPMAAVFVGMRLAEKPTCLRHFISGLFAGVAALFGINHGVYALLAFYLLSTLAFFKGDREHFAGKQAAFFGAPSWIFTAADLACGDPGILEAYGNLILRSTQYVNNFLSRCRGHGW